MSEHPATFSEGPSSNGASNGGGGGGTLRVYMGSPYMCCCDCCHIRCGIIFVMVCCFLGGAGFCGYGSANHKNLAAILIYLLEFAISITIGVLLSMSVCCQRHDLVKWAYILQMILVICCVIAIVLTLLGILVFTNYNGDTAGVLVWCFLVGGFYIGWEVWFLILIRKYRAFLGSSYPHPLPFLLLLHTTSIFFFFAQKFISSLID